MRSFFIFILSISYSSSRRGCEKVGNFKKWLWTGKNRAKVLRKLMWRNCGECGKFDFVHRAVENSVWNVENSLILFWLSRVRTLEIIFYILWLNLEVGHKEPCDNYTERYRKCSVFDIFKSAANLPVFQYIGKNKGTAHFRSGEDQRSRIFLMISLTVAFVTGSRADFSSICWMA